MNNLLAPIQAAQYLGLTVRTLKVWRRLKKGPPFLRLGAKAVRYELEALRAWAQLHLKGKPAPSLDDLQERTIAALTVARDRALDGLMAEVQYRAAIHSATGDAALASNGARWAAEMAEQVFPHSGDPSKPDIVAALAALECELMRRLHGETVSIPRELYLAMGGNAAWVEQFTEDGPLFYCAKAWALSRAVGIDLSPLVHAAFAAVPTDPEAYAGAIMAASAAEGKREESQANV